MEKNDFEMEHLCEQVHKAYCQYQLDHKGKEYWTKGDYSKLDDDAKEIDRYTVRAVLKAIKVWNKANPKPLQDLDEEKMVNLEELIKINIDFISNKNGINLKDANMLPGVLSQQIKDTAFGTKQVSRERFHSIMCEYKPTIAEDSGNPEWSQGELDKAYDDLILGNGLWSSICDSANKQVDWKKDFTSAYKSSFKHEDLFDSCVDWIEMFVQVSIRLPEKDDMDLIGFIKETLELGLSKQEIAETIIEHTLDLIAEMNKGGNDG